MLELMKEVDFRKEIRREPRTGYLFFGEEDYLKSFAIRHARETLCPDETFAFFNDLQIDALDFTPQKLLDALMPMPMMAERKLVTLRGLNFNSMRASEVDELCEVLEALSTYDYNVLIVSAAADCLDGGLLPKKPSAVLTRLSEYLTPVYFERCTSAKLAAWIGKHFAHYGVEAPSSLCASMPEYCGHSMYVLASEIEKLCYHTLAKGERVATEEDMRAVCTSVNEFDAFALTNMVMEGRQDAALAVLADYRFRRVDPVIIMGEVTRVICDMVAVRAMTVEGATAAEINALLKIHEYRIGLYQKSLRQASEKRLQRALDACVAADQALKLSPQGYMALERLICTI